MLIGAVCLFLLLLPELVRREITAQLATATAADVQLADVDFNPLTGRLAFERLTVTLKDEAQPVVTVQNLALNLHLRSLLRGYLRVEAVQLSGLRVVAVQHEDGQFNLNRLFSSPSPAELPARETEFPTLTVERFTLSAGQIDYQDHTRSPPARLTLLVKDLAAERIALQPHGLDTPVAVRLSGTLVGSPFHGEGRLSWQGTYTAVDATVEMSQLSLETLEPYLRDSLTLQRLSGSLSAHFRYRYGSGGERPPVHALGGTLTGEHVLFADPLSGRTALDLPRGHATIETIDFLSQEIKLASLELHNPKLWLFQTPAGLNWTALVRTADSTVVSAPSQSPAAPGWRFSLQRARLTGGEIIYRDSAWAENEAVTVIPEEFEVLQLGEEGGTSPLRFRMRVGEGTLAGEGNLRLSPFAVQAQIQLAGVELGTVHPLLTRVLTTESVSGTLDGVVHTELRTHDGSQVSGVSGVLDVTTLSLAGVPRVGSVVGWETAHLELQEGSSVIPLALSLDAQVSGFSLQGATAADLSIGQVKGSLRFSQGQSSRLGVAEVRPVHDASTVEDPSSALFVRGQVEITNLALTTPQAQQILLSCYQARAELRENSRLFPLDLHIQEVVLEYPYLQVVRTPAGHFQLFSSSSARDGQLPVSTPIPEPAAPARSFTGVHINQTKIRGGEVFFADETLTPPQTVFWQDVRLDLHNAGYPPPLAAVFSLHAFNEDGAPIQLQGTMERQKEQLLVRVRGEVKRLSLARFNPYLQPHIGYPIRKGALSLNFDLVIPGDRVRADTDVTLHDLGLGGARSPAGLEKQVGLPLSLVIALLKDLNGDITLRLPVAGRWNEPGFQLGGTILRAVRDALIGAVTSPLKLLGAVFIRKGTIQDFTLKPIRFIPGTSQLHDEGRAQLERLGRFLAQRPELDLRLSGHTGPADLQMLTDQLILAQLPEGKASTKEEQIPEAEPEGEALQMTPQDEVRRFLSYRLSQSAAAGAPVLSPQAAALLAQLRDQVVVAQQALDRLVEERLQAVITDLTAKRTIASARLHAAPERWHGREGEEVRYLIQAREGE